MSNNVKISISNKQALFQFYNYYLYLKFRNIIDNTFK